MTTLLQLESNYRGGWIFPLGAMGAANAAYNLHLLTGERTQRPLEDGVVLDTLRVLATNDRDYTREAVNTLNRVASALRKRPPGLYVDLVERTYLEDTVGRRSRVSAITVKVEDYRAIDWSLYRNRAVGVLEIERSAEWEYGAEQREEYSGVSVHGGTKATGVDTSDAGATPLIASLKMHGDSEPARITKFLVESPAAGKPVKKVWVGIKSPVLGGQNDYFIPQIKAGSPWWVDPNSTEPSTDSSIGAIDDASLRVKFFHRDSVENIFGSDDGPVQDRTTWKARGLYKLENWNAGTAVATYDELRHYVGSYHMLMRYRPKFPSGMDYTNGRLGFQGLTAWRPGAQFSENSAIVDLPRRILPIDNNQWHYVDLGVIHVGGEQWTNEMDQRAVLRGFSFGMRMALYGFETDGDVVRSTYDQVGIELSTPWSLYVDWIVPVPAERFLHVEFQEALPNYNRVEIHTDRAGGTRVFAMPGQEPASGLTSAYTIAGEAVPAALEDWTMPAEGLARIVLVTDTPENNSHSATATHNVILYTQKRTMAYVGRE